MNWNTLGSRLTKEVFSFFPAQRINESELFSFFTMRKAMIMTISVSKFEPFLTPAWLNKNDLGGWLKNVDSRVYPLKFGLGPRLLYF